MPIFWRKHPALFLGFFALLGTAAAVRWHLIYILVCAALLLSSCKKAHLYLCVLGVCICVLAYFSASFRSLHLPPIQKMAGSGTFHIHNLSISHSPFTRSLHYKGVFKAFKADDGTVLTDVPCSIFHPLKNAPLASKDYILDGVLEQKLHGFAFKPKKGKPWRGLENTWSFAAWRYDAKKAVSTYIKRHLRDPASATFLSALVTGEIDERALRIDFSRLGLQHILAISGFHFSFFALACGCLLRFFPFRGRIFSLIFLLAAYFFFLGNTPSILRAFTAISLYLFAQPIKRRTSGLNVLGAALILELGIDPQIITQLSFQLSFLCTFALLAFSPCMHELIAFFLPKRSLKEVEQMSLLDKHGFLLSALLRKTCAINFAVHLFSLPVLLHIFHKFPLLSLLYNLFFPFCVTLSLILLFCACLLTWICPPLAAGFHWLNNFWTSSLLSLTSNPPAYFDIVLRTDKVSFPIVISCLLLLSFIGMAFSYRKKTQIFYTESDSKIGNLARRRRKFFVLE